MSLLARTIKRIADQDRQMQQLQALVPNGEKRVAYLNALVDLAKVGLEPEQITVMAHMLARGGLDVKETPDV